MTSSQVQTIIAVGAATCWGALVLVWISGALYNAVRGPNRRGRRQFGSRTLVGVTVALVIVVLGIRVAVPSSAWQALTIEAHWAKLVGLAILAASTGFALWSRIVLGTMWSLNPAVKDRHELRTDGPYGITRHPIYTGLLGMLLGTVLIAGAGRSLIALPVVLVVLELKIRTEERLMLATFPEEYPRYRRRVPRLVPGARRRRRADAAGEPPATRSDATRGAESR